MSTASIIVKPLKTGTFRGIEHYEQMLLTDEEGYPFGLVHIDIFGGSGEYYERLMSGEPLKTTIVFSRLDRG